MVSSALGADGELIENKWYYNVGLQGGRRSAGVTSLAVRRADLLQHAGVVVRLCVAIAIAAPRRRHSLDDGGAADHRGDRQRLVHRSLRSHAVRSSTLGPAKSTWGLTTYGKLSRTGALGDDAHGDAGARRRDVAGDRLGAGAVLDVLRQRLPRRCAERASRSRETADPYLALPDGACRVESDFADSGRRVASLQFGGNGGLAGDSKQWTWETASDVQFYASGTPRHRVKLSGDVRLDGYSQTFAPNTLGTFSYNSLADLARERSGVVYANAQCARASRRRVERVSRGERSVAHQSELAGAVWCAPRGQRVHRRAGAESRRSTHAFGARTDYAPSCVARQPASRLQLQPQRTDTEHPDCERPRSIHRNDTRRAARRHRRVSWNDAGVAALDCARVDRSAWIADSVELHRRRGAASRLAAYGAQSSAIPSACAGGAASFADAAPNCSAFDRAWSMARSWRSNLAWSSIFKRFNYTLEGIYSLNLNQPGTYDLNFSNTPRFTLADEARPIFVRRGEHRSEHGSRECDGCARRARLRSRDERARRWTLGQQASDAHRLAQLDGRRLLELLCRGRLHAVVDSALQRGFDATTFGSPAERVWTRGDLDARHQFLFQGGYGTNDVTLTLLGRLHVRSAVHADRRWRRQRRRTGERSRVHSRSGARTDAAVASGLRALIASSPSSVRGVSRARLDAPPRQRRAARDRGRRRSTRASASPATADVSAVESTSGSTCPIHSAESINCCTAPTDCVGGERRRRPIRYCSTCAAGIRRRSDSQYSVNPRFGNTRPSTTTLRAPFRLTLDVSVDIGRQIEEQQVDRWLKPGQQRPSRRRRPTRWSCGGATTATFQISTVWSCSKRIRCCFRAIRPNRCRRVRAAYRVRMDSVWTTLADLSRRTCRISTTRTRRTHAPRRAIDGAWELTRVDLQRNLPEILNPVQLQLLPCVVKTLINSQGPVRIRLVHHRWVIRRVTRWPRRLRRLGANDASRDGHETAGMGAGLASRPRIEREVAEARRGRDDGNGAERPTSTAASISSRPARVGRRAAKRQRGDALRARDERRAVVRGRGSVEWRARIERRREERKRARSATVGRSSGGRRSRRRSARRRVERRESRQDQRLKRGQRANQLGGEKPHRVTALEMGDFVRDE